MVGGDQLGHLQPDDGGDPHDVKKVFAAGVKVVAFGQQYKRGIPKSFKAYGRAGQFHMPFFQHILPGQGEIPQDNVHLIGGGNRQQHGVLEHGMAVEIVLVQRVAAEGGVDDPVL